MDAQIFSDLHLEFLSDEPEQIDHFFKSLNVKGSIAILAGDICTISMMQPVLTRFCEKYDQVVYVTGNHEFYWSGFPEIENELSRLEEKLSNLTWLEQKAIEFDSVRILGTTLWFEELPGNEEYGKAISDFHYIDNFTDYVYKRNQQAVAFLNSEMRAGDIVVTHHLPCFESVPVEYRRPPESQLNRFYVCNMEKTIRERKPAIWIHGHTHSTQGFRLADTRICCYPCDYPREYEVLRRYRPRVIMLDQKINRCLDR